MTRPTRRITRTHLGVLAGLLVAFSLLTFLATDALLDEGPDHALHVALATLGTITGPMTGAIARSGHSGCLDFSLLLLAWCAPALAAGVGLQFLGGPGGRFARALRMGAWAAAWFAWFGGGIVSLGHALE